MKSNEFIDKIYDQRQMTASWAFWNMEALTDDDVEASRMPSRSVSETPKDSYEDICISCAFKQLREDNENLQAEVYDLKNSVQHLINMLGGK